MKGRDLSYTLSFSTCFMMLHDDDLNLGSKLVSIWIKLFTSELDVTVNIDIVFSPHTHTHTRYRHQSNSKAAASSYVRRMPQFYSPRAIWSIFQVPKIVDMDINSLLGIIGYNLYLKHIRWCVNQKYILIYSITHHACFVIVFYLVTCFTWWLLIIQEHGKYQETVLTTRLLKFMPAIPPDVLSIK